MISGQNMYSWVQDLFPICRSITGEGVRQSLIYLQNLLPNLKIHEIDSGSEAFDWTVPDEWNVKAAYIEYEDGERVVDFSNNNLHLVSYSEPYEGQLSLDELQGHLHSLPEKPDAIPYVTSYYNKNWGFCLPHKQRQNLKEGLYTVKIESAFNPNGVLNYADLVIPGQSEEEVLISTYICHPSMANNELSGVVVSTALALWLQSLPERRYTYRFVFVPETIGAIVYLSKNLKALQAQTKAGFVLTCIGDDREYSYLESRSASTIADQIALEALEDLNLSYKRYTYLERGSDERQYCSPGIDLPVCTLSRTKFYEYPEYHTSKDDLSLISPDGLQGGFDLVRKCVEKLEYVSLYKAKQPCEPQLGKYDLYPKTHSKDTRQQVHNLINVLAYCDGWHTPFSIAQRIDISLQETQKILDLLEQKGLIEA